MIAKFSPAFAPDLLFKKRKRTWRQRLGRTLAKHVDECCGGSIRNWRNDRRKMRNTPSFQCDLCNKIAKKIGEPK